MGDKNKLINKIDLLIKQAKEKDPLDYSESIVLLTKIKEKLRLVCWAEDAAEAQRLDKKDKPSNNDLVEDIAGRISDCFELKSDKSCGGYLYYLETDEAQLRIEIRKLLQEGK